MNRPRRRNLVLTAAICASLVMHGLVYDAIVVRRTQEIAATIRQPAFDLKAWLAAHKPADAPIDEDAIELPKPPDSEIEDLFGERGGTGKGLNSAAGDTPMQTRQADQDQAQLTPRPGAPTNGGDGGQNSARKTQPTAAQQPTAAKQAMDAVEAMSIAGKPDDAPRGAPLIPAPPPTPPPPFRRTPPSMIARIEPAPITATTRSTVTQKDSAATQPVAVQPATQPVLAQAPPTTTPIADASTTKPLVKVAEATKAEKMPEGESPKSDHPTPDKPPTSRPTPVAVASVDRVQPVAQPTPPSNSGSPGHGQAGEAGHKSESESDEFSEKPVVTYHNGRVDARDGIKVKTVRPKLTEAGELALASMEEPVIIVKVHVDENGIVTDADYLRKSNIPEVDQPHLRAAFEWVFDPTRDKLGNPIRDSHIIAFNWR